MKLVKVGAAVLNQTPLDWDGNRTRIERAIAAARADGVSILCLPELCITGYGCEDAFHSPGLHATSLEVLLELAPATGGMIVCVGLPLFYNRALYNAAALLVDGRVAGFAAKRNLAGDGIHYEPRWFKPWPEGHVARIEVGGSEVPLGADLFDCGGIKIGFEMCEDAWVANRPGGHLALEGADVILNPSASHFAFGKHEVRQRFVIEGSRAFGVAYVYANLLGNEAGRIIYDGGALIASAGQLVAVGERFSYRDFEVTSAVVDITDNRMIQARTGSFRPEVEDRAVDVPVRLSAARAGRRGGAGAHVGGRRAGQGGGVRARRRARRCSTTCARAAPAASSCRCRAGPTRPRSAAWSRSWSTSAPASWASTGCKAKLCHIDLAGRDDAARHRRPAAHLRLSGDAQQRPGHARGRAARSRRRSAPATSSSTWTPWCRATRT